MAEPKRRPKASARKISAPRSASPPPVVLDEPGAWVPFVQNSYVLSRFWAWWSRVELYPQVRIPVPRFLTYRDP